MNHSEYAAIDAVNWSTLKEITASPRRYRHRLLTPRTDTPSLAFGRAAHCAVLEPDAFASRYIARPDGIDRRTRDGKAAWEDFVASAGDRTILEGAQYASALAVGAAVRAHPVARQYLDGAGETEYAIAWSDAETGIACKARLDRVSDAPPMVVDLKTARTIEPRAFGRAAAAFSYHAQLAWYREGYRAAVGAELPALIVAVESEAPHDVAVYDLDARALEIGEFVFRSALRRLAECRARDEWPGACPDRMPLALPVYADPDYDSDGEWSVREV